MNPIPDAWPPEQTSRKVLPLFPLPDVWLFPALLLPLHVFEKRYRQMVEDCLDGPGRIVLGTVELGHEEEIAGTPPIYSIGGLGEIGRHVHLPDGRFHVWLMGLARVRVREVPSDRLYRKVEVESAQEVPVRREREDELADKLREAVAARTGKDRLPSHVARLSDLLILSMPLPHEARNRLYAELDVEKRAVGALEEHGIRPELPERRKPPPEAPEFDPE